MIFSTDLTSVFITPDSSSCATSTFLVLIAGAILSCWLDWVSRWSQIMYMYYLLGYKLMELPISDERKEVRPQEGKEEDRIDRENKRERVIKKKDEEAK